MRCGIALGSNIEHCLANIREGGKRSFSLHESGPLIRVSSIDETAPVDCEPGTMPYFNAVMEIDFTGAPVALLDRLLEIKSAMGRASKRPRNSPRIIDLGVLYAGNLVLNNPEMIVPHPRLRQRRFALTSLAETYPGLVLPGQLLSVQRLLAELDDPGQVTRLGVPLFDRE
jgi:2-amino-4-hydroxy-6-hydroxymethyldihydropteridine diphosphokinase